MEIVRLTAKDYDEWLNVLNTVFTAHNKRNMDFERELPKMCVRDDAHMGKHLAAKEDGKICALLGIYPLRTQIGGEELLFSTVGNVATLPAYEGKGYMKALMKEAMKELERIGADASRLGGKRQRYNRYGYEACGMNYYFTIDDHTTKYCADNKTAVFKKITSKDTDALSFIDKIRKQQVIRVDRTYGNAFEGDYAVLSAWNSDVYIAMDENGGPIGYMSVSQNGNQIAEIEAVDFESLKTMLFSWQKFLGAAVSFSLYPSKVEEVRYFSGICAGMSLSSPCHFKIINFDKVADALLKVKASYDPDLMQGEEVITIREWGNLWIYNKNGTVFCKKTDKEGTIILDRLEATRFLFGPFTGNTVTNATPFLSCILPLPLSWSTLDRV